ncbi:hypothetical protein B1R94_02460 [Mycolicibacterium litorale]|nr:hypothetical protein B1R94_02460 [Mycolicibacterium litorale]
MQGWDSVIDAYVAYMKAIGRPKTTIDLRKFQILYLAKSINLTPAAITHDDLIGWFSVHDWKPETRRSYRSGVRGFFAWACKHGHIAADPAVEIPQVKIPKAAARPAPDPVYQEARTVASARTALMLRLAAEGGLRRAEVAQVHTQDVRYTPKGAQLLVHGKGSRERVIPISDSLAAQIVAGAGGHTPGGGDKGWLFPSSRGGHVSPAYVGTLCSDALPGIWTVHKLRHRFASKAYRGTRNLRAVQELLGHANVAITERYTAVDDDEMRAAMMAAVA